MLNVEVPLFMHLASWKTAAARRRCILRGHDPDDLDAAFKLIADDLVTQQGEILGIHLENPQLKVSGYGRKSGRCKAGEILPRLDLGRYTYLVVYYDETQSREHKWTAALAHLEFFHGSNFGHVGHAGFVDAHHLVNSRFLGVMNTLLKESNDLGQGGEADRPPQQIVLT